MYPLSEPYTYIKTCIYLNSYIINVNYFGSKIDKPIRQNCNHIIIIIGIGGVMPKLDVTDDGFDRICNYLQNDVYANLRETLQRRTKL